MKKSLVILAVALGLCSGVVSRATDDPITDQENLSKGTENESPWEKAIEKKYNLTDAQIDKLKSQGWSYPQIAIAADLAKVSGKPFDQIVQMRESKMGWGQIAKELGVPPKEIGHSIASLRHEIHERREHDGKFDRMERHADHDGHHDHGDHDHGDHDKGGKH